MPLRKPAADPLREGGDGVERRASRRKAENKNELGQAQEATSGALSGEVLFPLVASWRLRRSFRSNLADLKTFAWQLGYAAFSVSQSQVPAVKRCIERQEQHHAKRGFQQEMRALLRSHELEFDEGYVWD